LQFGFFTQALGALWKFCEAICPICCEADESILHLFFQCSRVRTRWKHVLSQVALTTLDFGSVSTPIDLREAAIKRQHKSPSGLILLAKVLWFMEGKELICLSRKFRHCPFVSHIRSVQYKIQASYKQL
jgi:hypothetical protein